MVSSTRVLLAVSQLTKALTPLFPRTTGVGIAVCSDSCPPRRIQHIHCNDDNNRHHDTSNDTVFLRHHWHIFIYQLCDFFHLLSPKLPTKRMPSQTNRTNRTRYQLTFRSCLCLFSTCNHIARTVAHIARKIATHIMPRVKVTRYRYCSMSIRGFSPVNTASNPNTTVSVNKINASNSTTHVRLT